MGRHAAVPVVVTLLLLAAPARAGGDAREVELGAGVYGLVNLSILDEPSEADKLVRVGGALVKVPYPGFVGAGGGGGLYVNAMWRGIIGLDVGLHASLDQGTGDINDFDITLKQVALHVPILLRVAAPLERVRPFLLVGPELVFPQSPEAEVEAPLPSLEAAADRYLAWAFGLGFDVRVPAGALDLRVPVTLRFTLNPDVGDTVAERIDGVSPSGDLGAVRSEWQYQVLLTIGFAVYFL